jgi:hypothetical membrane protein
LEQPVRVEVLVMVDTDIREKSHRAVRPRRARAAVIGLVLPVVYLLFAIAAYLRYPSSFSPRHNWLSDLGNRELNPDGAYFYIVGCALTGALLIVFYLSLRTWAPTGTRRQQRQLGWVQGFGSLSGLALIMTAAFPQDRLGPHTWWNAILFGSFAPALFLSVLAVRRPGYSTPALVAVTVAAYLADAAWLLLFQTFWLEWVTVALIMGHIWLLSAATRRLADRPLPVASDHAAAGPPRP